MWLLLKIIFADKLNVDDRIPIVTFTLFDRSFGLLLPSLSFWMQLFATLVIQSLIGNILSIIVYKYIVRRRGSTSAFLVGYGFVMPFLLLAPYQIIRILDLRNRCFRVSSTALPTMGFFRCLEAMYGFSPSAQAVESKLTSYGIYFSSIIEFDYYDPIKQKDTIHPQRATRREIIVTLIEFVGKFFVIGFLFSLLDATLYAPFGSVDDDDDDGDGMMNNGYFGWLSPVHFANNFIVAVLTHLCLSTGTLGVGLMISVLSGMKTRRVFDNPMFGSRSPSDFWGRRWNNLIHGLLKRGVFKPIMKYGKKSPRRRTIATIATFVASGLLHEYILTIITYVHDDEKDDTTGVCPSCFRPSYGNHSLFFAWNAALILLESHFVSSSSSMAAFLRKIVQSLPTYVVSIMVVLMALPVAHLFTDEYWKSGFYSDYMIGFPIIIPL